MTVLVLEALISWAFFFSLIALVFLFGLPPCTESSNSEWATIEVVSSRTLMFSFDSCGKFMIVVFVVPKPPVLSPSCFITVTFWLLSDLKSGETFFLATAALRLERFSLCSGCNTEVSWTCLLFSSLVSKEMLDISSLLIPPLLEIFSPMTALVFMKFCSLKLDLSVLLLSLM